MNSRQQSSLSNSGSPYGGHSNQITSPGSSAAVPPMQANPNFQSPAHSSSSNHLQNGNGISATNQTHSFSTPASMSMHQSHSASEAEPNIAQSSVQKILREVMSGQLNGAGGMGGSGSGSLSNDVKHANGLLPAANGPGLSNANTLLVNGSTPNSAMVASSFGGMVGSLVQPPMVNGLRSAMVNNPMLNGRAGAASIMRDPGMTNQQDFNNQLMNGLRAVNGFNDLQYDWKPSP
ncbi:hypothetical protein MLD38_001936 [Melastoma candidum]|nr:hypothetical protein MLD38_001936 [Melastoma candidum]